MDWKYKTEMNYKFSDKDKYPVPIFNYDYNGLYKLDDKSDKIIKNEIKEYLDKNPSIINKITNIDLEKIDNLEPSGHPHTKYITVGNVCIEYNNKCIIFNFNFNNLFNNINL